MKKTSTIELDLVMKYFRGEPISRKVMKNYIEQIKSILKEYPVQYFLENNFETSCFTYIYSRLNYIHEHSEFLIKKLIFYLESGKFLENVNIYNSFFQWFPNELILKHIQRRCMDIILYSKVVNEELEHINFVRLENAKEKLNLISFISNDLIIKLNFYRDTNFFKEYKEKMELIKNKNIPFEDLQ